jgi:lysozyme
MPIDRSKLANMLILHEGMKLNVYDDATGQDLTQGDTAQGHPTIGVGRNIAGDGLGISEEEARFMLLNDLERIENEAKTWPPYANLDGARQAVLLDMLFNMGMTRFNPKKWPKMFLAITEQNWEEAANQMRSSVWARQVKSRSERLAKMMEFGVWID